MYLGSAYINCIPEVSIFLSDVASTGGDLHPIAAVILLLMAMSRNPYLLF